MLFFNADKIRQDFPIYKRKINGKEIVYMDSACMSLRPRQVIERMDYYYETMSACAGRSAHRLAKETTEEYEGSRKTIQKFIGAKHEQEVVFTRNTSEGINIVANSIGMKKGDTVLTTDREHNSNLVPWQVLAKRTGCSHKVVRSNDDMTFSMENLEDALGKSVKMVSVVHSSNLDGYTLPIREIIKAAHDNGSLVMLDAAQSAPHKSLDVNRLDVDFLAFSGHKMLGPTGTGVLYGKKDLLDGLPPYNTGGDTVEDTTYEDHSFLKSPDRFEAGLQDYAGAMGLAEAAKYLAKVGMDHISDHEVKLNRQVTDSIMDIKGLKILGPQDPKERGGVISFTVEGIDSHDIALMLSESSNIMIRSGAHCVHSWFNGRGLKGSARASMYLYNTKEEAAKFSQSLHEICEMLRK